jgi:hypothetical protein
MKIIIYQVLPRLFGNRRGTPVPDGTLAENGCGKLADFTPTVLRLVRGLGCTHIWYTGLLEHATQTAYPASDLPADAPTIVKGRAGSPYAIRDYYAIDPDLAVSPENRMAEFEALVERTHRAGLRLIMDFVPNHVSPANRNFAPDNYCYAPGSDERLSDYDWTDTVKLNYENRDTWNRMRDILCFWAERGVDGFRCDMAEMVPVDFWAWVIPQVKVRGRGIIFIGEVYDPSRYEEFLFQGTFDYLYDKVGLYDTLRGVIMGTMPASAITGCWQQAGHLQPRLLNFLENHDEQRLASAFFADDPLRGRPALVVAAAMGTNPFLLYFGQELGERGMEAEGFSGCDGRTSIFDYGLLPVLRKRPTPAQRALRQYYAHILRRCNEQEAFRSGGFYDLMYANLDRPDFNPERHYAFLRCSLSELWLVVANFDEQEAEIGVWIPEHVFTHFELRQRSLRSEDNQPPFASEAEYRVSVPGYDAVMLRFATTTVPTGRGSRRRRVSPQ